MPVVLFLIFAFVFLTVASGTYVFVAGCVRRKELPWLVEEELRKTDHGKYYDYIADSYQWVESHDCMDVFTTSYDGLRLHALWIPAENARGTLLFAHGYRSTKFLDFAFAFDFYHNMGMNLLIPDQRAHGESEGKYITFGVKESRDMLSWLNYHNENYGSVPVILSGISMGASTMMYLADKVLPDNVRGIVADCGFTSPKDILSVIFKRVTHLPAAPSLVVTDLLAGLFAGFRLNEEDSRRTLRKNRLPIFMVHGVDDSFVPCSMTKDGYAVCAGKKQLLLVDGAEHGVSFLIAKEKYTQMLSDFLDTNVGPKQ